MSFVDLMASHVWNETDIVNRTESLIRQYYSMADEQILNRKVAGATLGQYELASEEVADIGRYAEICEAARQEGIAARADMVRLQAALDYEAAVRRLAMPAVTEPTTVLASDEEGTVIEVPNPAIAQDEGERAAAQLVVDAASAETLGLAAARCCAFMPASEVAVELNGVDPAGTYV